MGSCGFLFGNMSERAKYRKWYNPDGEFNENYLMVHPRGLMLQISFAKDIYGEKVLIYQTKPLNPFKIEVFLQHKEVCSKADWVKAQKKAENYIKAKRLEALVK